MKDSGISWFDYIPKDWKAGRIKDIISLLSDYTANGSFSDLAKNVEYHDFEDYARLVRLTDLRENLSNDGVYVDEYAYNYLAKSSLIGGEILVANVGAYAGLFCEMPKVNYPATLAPNMFMIRTNINMLQHYLFYVGNATFIWEQLSQKAISSAQPKLNKTDVKTAYLPIPTIEEQQKISDYLDIRCSEIDSLTADIQKQIEILEEHKKSLIFRVISKGISYNTLKKTTSDIWKEIPETWKLSDIKYIFEIVKRIAGKEGFDVLSVTQKGLKVKDITNMEGQLAENYSGYQFVYPTDYVMNHMDLLTGWVDCSTMFGVTSPDYRVFRLRDKTNNDLTYFKYVMQCCYMNKVFYSLGQGVSNLGRWRLQTSSFNNFMIPVPPLENQQQIAEYLNQKFSEIDSIIADKRKQIETLEEYKNSIIFEYVTGKKEVNDYDKETNE